MHGEGIVGVARGVGDQIHGIGIVEAASLAQVVPRITSIKDLIRILIMF